jgi:isochorismate synthase
MTSRFFDRALAEERPGWRVIVVPVRRLALDALAFSCEPGVLWDPPSGPRFSGVGRTGNWELGAGKDVAARVGAEGVRLLRMADVVAHPEVPASLARPRFFGGLAFGPRQAAPWDAFGSGAFVWPRWTYGEDGLFSTLALALGPDEGRTPAARATLIEELERIEALSDEPDRGVADEPRASRIVTEPSFDTWCREVETIQHLIRDGRAKKIVAARHTRIDFSAPISHRQIVRALAGQPLSTRFAFHRNGATFVGATPELLVAKQGARVFTEALAGTARTADEAAMRASPKEREEHALVVDFIARTLSRHAVSLDRAREPEVRRLRDVVHLVTPIAAALDPRDTANVIDLATALHPTPAVAGVPRAHALDWIREHEPFPRGWYASPIGWFDANGDGELRVALRSALLEDRCAHLFAGAGVVAGSDARAEYEEAHLKERTLRSALGVEA